MANRVVVTGMGAVTPVGNSVEQTWKNLKNGVSGITGVTQIDVTDHPSKIAGEVKNFDPADFMEKKVARKCARFTQLFIASAHEAVDQSGIVASGFYDPYRIATILGNGIGGFEIMEEGARKLAANGPKAVPPLSIPKLLTNEGAGNVAILYDLRGPCYSFVTACASGTDAIGMAFRAIKNGEIDAAVVGGAEATLTHLGFACFSRLQALSTGYNDTPEKASRPFDKGRDGFVMAEGSGTLVLENLDNAVKRGAEIHAEIGGYGITCDAYHLTSPSEEGAHTAKAMEFAMQEAALTAADIGYINAHGTSTEINDPTETRAVKAAFGDQAKKIPISSTKSMTGHMLGGTGAVEIISCIQAIKDQFAPPTINLEEADKRCDLDYVPGRGRAASIRAALSNSLGFGGHNASLIIKAFEE